MVRHTRGVFRSVDYSEDFLESLGEAILEAEARLKQEQPIKDVLSLP